MQLLSLDHRIGRIIATRIRHKLVFFALLGHGLPDHIRHKVNVALVLTLAAANCVNSKDILLRGAQPSNIYHGLVHWYHGLRIDPDMPFLKPTL